MPDTRPRDEWLGRALTPRERQVLQLLASGVSRPTMGRRLGISTQTVKNHLTVIYAKLGAWCAPHAVAIGLRRGLIE